MKLETQHRFSVSDYCRLGELGILGERTELIKGIVIDMDPIGPWHAAVVTTLTQTFIYQARARFGGRVQQPIDLGPASQPQPD